MSTSSPRNNPHRRTLLALALITSATVAGLPTVAAAAPLDRVVVSGPGAAEAVTAAGGRVLDPLPLVGGVAALLPRDARVPSALQVTADRPLTTQSSSAPAGTAVASTVRATLGLGAPAGEGKGVTVAVVDTGVTKGLPDLAGRVEHLAVVGEAGEDGLGHGTFIAGLVASSGASTGGATAGVAPGADVLDVKVADAEGNTSLVDVLRGLQAVATHGDVDVVNLSLSSESPLPSVLDPLAVALDRLVADGTTVVVPSGNNPTTVSSPGNDPRLLTVGGLAEGGTPARDDDTVASWSGRKGAKPDLVAPGQSLVSLLAPDSQAAAALAQRNDLPAGHGVGSGTSFATAVVSGAAAALLGERADLTPSQVKDLVTGTAYRDGKALTKPGGAGAGGLDLAAALTAKAPKDKAEDADEVPGDLALWEAFVAAVLDEDPEAAASSWSKLSPQARQWSARQWSSADDDARDWSARQWSARQWSASGWSRMEWSARQWSARQWAARQWSAGDWSARQWSARQWSARQWSARQWSGSDWSARQWSARQWSARQWSSRTWS